MPYTDLPEPKFQRGQTVYFTANTRKAESLPCPDCLGSKKWKVETPAGATYEAACQRCGGGYMTSRYGEIPPLDYEVAVPKTGSMVIDNIEVRTKGHFQNDGPTVMYYASNHGWSEGALFADEDAAMSAAQAEAAKANAKARETPERLAQKHIGALRFEDARLDQFQNGLWNSWQAYRSLIEKLDSYLEDKDSLGAEDTEYLKSDIRWEVEYRAKQDRPLDKLVEAVWRALNADPSGLAEAYAALPEALRPNPKEALKAQLKASVADLAGAGS